MVQPSLLPKVCQEKVYSFFRVLCLGSVKGKVMIMNTIMEYTDTYRISCGFYTIIELINSVGKTNQIVDPFSVLISKKVDIGSNNIIYPGVQIISDSSSVIEIGNNNTFCNNTQIISEDCSRILIRDHNDFGYGGICIKCNINKGKMLFGGYCRIEGRINIFGNCNFGQGSQILGTISVYNCTLGEGGDYNDPDPNKRAGLIKGIGTARNLNVGMGMVINGFGDFDQSKIEPQINYHKK